MKKRKKLRVIIDTNLFVSGIILLQGYPFELLELLRKNTYTLLTSKEIIEELEDVLKRPKFKRYKLSQERIVTLIRFVKKRSETTISTNKLAITIRDPKDKNLLSTAIEGKVDCIITGDEDLLVLSGDPKLGKLKITTAKDFISIWETQTNK